MKIPRISATSDVCFLHSSLRICFAYIAVLFVFSTSASSSLRQQTLYRVLLLFGKTRRQQTNKVKRYWSRDKSLERARSPSTCSDQRYLLSHVVTLDHAIIKGRCYRHKSIAINIYALSLKIQCPRPTQKYFKTNILRFSDVNIYCWFYLREKSMIR